ncbi:hypothetical protein CCM_03814 [Cordyceps militaris CM01]|uniref:Uncharacterized protein n=1 Tax=Cordyceps militaris (strain CM01) TaxID=983644 RepID=G3JGS7_CORMM|nr:uncharacterized protein CCM_03814 [Cordyceps militaris CM01]EGX92441.1 hypothetical protein CCM_03814 [Cordyceps militaris CM01]
MLEATGELASSPNDGHDLDREEEKNNKTKNRSDNSLEHPYLQAADGATLRAQGNSSKSRGGNFSLSGSAKRQTGWLAGLASTDTYLVSSLSPIESRRNLATCVFSIALPNPFD